MLLDREPSRHSLSLAVPLEVFLKLVFRGLEWFFILSLLLFCFGFRWEEVGELEFCFPWQCHIRKLPVVVLRDISDDFISLSWSRSDSRTNVHDWQFINVLQIAFDIVLRLKGSMSFGEKNCKRVSLISLTISIETWKVTTLSGCLCSDLTSFIQKLGRKTLSWGLPRWYSGYHLVDIINFLFVFLFNFIFENLKA